MGTLVGHSIIGLAFFFIGLWHLFNQIKMYAQQPRSFQSFVWFSYKKLRHLELYIISLGASIYITLELFRSPPRHQALASDGSIPKSHLHNFEHSTITLAFLVYGILALVLDKLKAKYDYAHHDNIAHFVATIALCEEFLIFHFHSTDHQGLEGHYHLLLQLSVIVSIMTTLLGIFLPKSFLISSIRSFSFIIQGLWLVVIGVMLYTPSLMPKGCFIHLKEFNEVVSCPDEEDLGRAKSLVNLQFCWYVTTITIVLVCFYATMIETYGKNVEYTCLAKGVQDIKI